MANPYSFQFTKLARDLYVPGGAERPVGDGAGGDDGDDGLL